MKLFVDEMPETPKECPYAKMNYDPQEDSYYYTCSWNNCLDRCYWTEDCPFFTTKEDNDEG